MKFGVNWGQILVVWEQVWGSDFDGLGSVFGGLTGLEGGRRWGPKSENLEKKWVRGRNLQIPGAGSRIGPGRRSGTRSEDPGILGGIRWTGVDPGVGSWPGLDPGNPRVCRSAGRAGELPEPAGRPAPSWGRPGASPIDHS